jgi:hypothetical protein
MSKTVRTSISDWRSSDRIHGLSAERGKLGEKNLRFTVFRFVHAADLRRKVHAFRGGVCENRAFWALNRSAISHTIILLSIAYAKSSAFSADPIYKRDSINSENLVQRTRTEIIVPISQGRSCANWKAPENGRSFSPAHPVAGSDRIYIHCKVEFVFSPIIRPSFN